MSRGYDAARVRSLLSHVQLPRAYRILRSKYRHQPLGVAPGPSRFSDPDRQYCVLYASTSVCCAVWEAILRNRLDRKKRRTIDRAEIESRDLATLRSTKPLRLVDLRGGRGRAIGAPTAVTKSARHASGQALSTFVYRNVPTADGFLFSSRFTDDPCVAVFDRSLLLLRSRSVRALVREGAFLRCLDAFDIELIDNR